MLRKLGDAQEHVYPSVPRNTETVPYGGIINTDAVNGALEET